MRLATSVYRFSPLVSKHLLKLAVLLYEADLGLIVKAEKVELPIVTSSSTLHYNIFRCQLTIFLSHKSFSYMVHKSFDTRP